MLFQKLALLSAIAGFAAAQDVDNNDIPQQCQDVCNSLVTASRGCDNSTNDDGAEIQCVCNTQNAGAFIPACDACVETFRRREDDNDESDVREILRSCSLSTTTYNSASSGAPQPTGSMSGPTITGSMPTPISTGGMSPTGGAGAGAGAGASTSPISTNAAMPAKTAAAGAAMGLGAFGVAMGLL